MESADAHEIIPGLWLGNARASMDEAFLKAKQIHVVFNCTKNLPFCPVVPIQYRVPVDDNLEEQEIRNMELWSSEIAFKMMGHYRANHTILVHCMAGMQRSAAAMAIMMIAHFRIHAAEAMARIKGIRSIAFHPRANFGRSIESFDHRFHGEIVPAMRSIHQKEP